MEFRKASRVQWGCKNGSVEVWISDPTVDRPPFVTNLASTENGVLAVFSDSPFVLKNGRFVEYTPEGEREIVGDVDGENWLLLDARYLCHTGAHPNWKECYDLDGSVVTPQFTEAHAYRLLVRPNGQMSSPLAGGMVWGYR